MFGKRALKRKIIELQDDIFDYRRILASKDRILHIVRRTMEDMTKENMELAEKVYGDKKEWCKDCQYKKSFGEDLIPIPPDLVAKLEGLTSGRKPVCEDQMMKLEKN